MKKQILIILFIIYLSLFTLHLSAQSCLPEGISFTTQEQINNFQAQYPDCTEIEGDVGIANDYVSNDYVTNLNGLSVLTSIGGNFVVAWANSLIDFSGLENLDSIGGDLFIGVPYSRKAAGNDSLINLNGLNNLSNIGGDFYIGFNQALINLNGLNNLSNIGGDFYIASNPALVDIEGLHNLTSISGDLIIEGNGLLSDLSGLENLISITGNLEIGRIHWYRQPFCRGNSSLVTLDGLNNLSSVGGDLSIVCNDSLTSLEALENLTSILGDLNIGKYEPPSFFAGNPLISSLTGLDNIAVNSIGNLNIAGNYSLTNCEVQSICDYLVSPNGTFDIQNNASGCNSPEEVQQMCDSIQTPIQELYNNKTFNISPNPSSGFSNIQFTVKEKGFVNIELLNTSGVKVKSLLKEIKMPGTHEMEIDLRDLPKGIYFCVLKTNPGRPGQTTKIIKI